MVKPCVYYLLLSLHKDHIIRTNVTQHTVTQKYPSYLEHEVSCDNHCLNTDLLADLAK